MEPHMSEGRNAHREVPVADPTGMIMARIDIDREARCGVPEAVFAMGKTPEETVSITETLVERRGFGLVTRANAETIQALRRRWPNLAIAPHSGAALAGRPPERRAKGRWVAICAAGTSDLPVAEEAAFTLDALGLESRIIADIGVAGIHRLLAHVDSLRQASVILAVAGMEGALPSVLAGLVPTPLVAVPTSVGYGASLGGLSALLGMLNSCSPGICVANIDNGFGAAVAAARIITHTVP